MIKIKTKGYPITLDPKAKITVTDENNKVHSFHAENLLDIVPYSHNHEHSPGMSEPDKTTCSICNSPQASLRNFLYMGYIYETQRVNNDKLHYQDYDSKIYLCDDCVSLLDKIEKLCDAGCDICALTYALLPPVQNISTVAKAIHCKCNQKGISSNYLRKYLTRKPRKLKDPELEVLVNELRALAEHSV